MLDVRDLTKIFPGEGRAERPWRLGRHSEGTVPAVNDVSFHVREGELFTLLGPSGCGKTTTLRCVAGLERPSTGTIKLDATTLFDSDSRINVPANKRALGMVFQSYAIWPHMSVFSNVAFPLEVPSRRHRLSKTEIEDRVTRVLEIVELGEYASRPATKLSGGQQQRLALARAMVTEPTLMLLDEPLSNLDAQLRESMRLELKRLQRELGLTTIYVTHDQTEALVLSSRIAVMNAGRIVQVGTPREVYTKPSSRFCAEFIGTSNFVTGTLREGGEQWNARVETSEGPLWTAGAFGLPSGSKVLVSLRPEDLEISTTTRAGSVPNEWRGSVLTRAFMGDSIDHVVGVGKQELRVRCRPSVSIPPGSEVYVTIPPESVTLVPD